MEKADAPTGKEEAWDELTDEEPAGERDRCMFERSISPSTEEVSEVGVPGNNSELSRYMS